MDKLQKAVADILEYRTPVPDTESDYVPRVFLKALQGVLEAETNRRNKLVERIWDMEEILFNIFEANEAGRLDEMGELCGSIRDHFSRRGICVRCGSAFAVHEADGSCVVDLKPSDPPRSVYLFIKGDNSC